MNIIFFISLFFAPIAAICAYLITYEEYKHHFDHKKAIIHSLEIAVITLLVFIAIGFITGVIFRKGL